jgi:hypothetical protein
MNNFHNTMQRFTFCTGKAVREEVFFQLISIGISIAYKFHNPACFYGKKSSLLRANQGKPWGAEQRV